MVTCIIYMHFSSSTKQQDHSCRRECYDFVTFDIRLLYLLGVYLCDVGRSIINWEVMALLSMTRLVSFNKWEGGSLLSEWLEEAERVVEEFPWEKTHSSGLDIGRYEVLTREENETSWDKGKSERRPMDTSSIGGKWKRLDGSAPVFPATDNRWTWFSSTMSSSTKFGGTVHVSHFYAVDICSNVRTAVDDLCDFGGKAKAKCRKRSRSTVSLQIAKLGTVHNAIRTSTTLAEGRSIIDTLEGIIFRTFLIAGKGKEKNTCLRQWLRGGCSRCESVESVNRHNNWLLTKTMS